MTSNKCTEKLSCHVPEWLALEFQERAHQAHCTPSELLRDLLCINVLAKTWGEHVDVDRRQALRLEAPDKASLRACT